MFVLVHQDRVFFSASWTDSSVFGTAGKLFPMSHFVQDSNSLPWQLILTLGRENRSFLRLPQLLPALSWRRLTDTPALINTTWHVRHPLLKVSVALVSLITNFVALIPNIYVHTLNTSLNGWQRRTLVYGYLYINTGSPSFNPPTHSSSSSVSCHWIKLPLRNTVYVLCCCGCCKANAFTTVQCVMTRETKHKKKKKWSEIWFPLTHEQQVNSFRSGWQDETTQVTKPWSQVIEKLLHIMCFGYTLLCMRVHSFLPLEDITKNNGCLLQISQAVCCTAILNSSTMRATRLTLCWLQGPLCLISDA